VGEPGVIKCAPRSGRTSAAVVSECGEIAEDVGTSAQCAFGECCGLAFEFGDRVSRQRADATEDRAFDAAAQRCEQILVRWCGRDLDCSRRIARRDRRQAIKVDVRATVPRVGDREACLVIRWADREQGKLAGYTDPYASDHSNA
jgi:hypothetical protein